MCDGWRGRVVVVGGRRVSGVRGDDDCTITAFSAYSFGPRRLDSGEGGRGWRKYNVTQQGQYHPDLQYDELELE